MWSLIPILISKIGVFQLLPKSDSLFIQLMLKPTCILHSENLLKIDLLHRIQISVSRYYSSSSSSSKVVAKSVSLKYVFFSSFHLWITLKWIYILEILTGVRKKSKILIKSSQFIVSQPAHLCHEILFLNNVYHPRIYNQNEKTFWKLCFVHC